MKVPNVSRRRGKKIVLFLQLLAGHALNTQTRRGHRDLVSLRCLQTAEDPLPKFLVSQRHGTNSRPSAQHSRVSTVSRWMCHALRLLHEHSSTRRTDLHRGATHGALRVCETGLKTPDPLDVETIHESQPAESPSSGTLGSERHEPSRRSLPFSSQSATRVPGAS